MVAGHADRAAFNGGPEKPVFIACLGDLKLDEIISTTTQLSVVMVVSVAVESITHVLSLISQARSYIPCSKIQNCKSITSNIATPVWRIKYKQNKKLIIQFAYKLRVESNKVN